MNPLVCNNFNEALKRMSYDYGELSYEEFGKHIKSAAEEVVTEVVEENNGQLEHSRECLAPIIKEVNKLLYKSKMSNGTDEVLAQQYKSARSNIKKSVEISKLKLISHLVDDTKHINTNHKKAWEHIKIVTDGFKNHHFKKIIFKFRDENRLTATLDAENIQLAANDF